MNRNDDPYNRAYCEMCGKLRNRKRLKWHRIFFMGNCALPTHPELFTFHNLCEDCYKHIHELAEEQKVKFPELWAPKKEVAA